MIACRRENVHAYDHWYMYTFCCIHVHVSPTLHYMDIDVVCTCTYENVYCVYVHCVYVHFAHVYVCEKTVISNYTVDHLTLTCKLAKYEYWALTSYERIRLKDNTV